MTNTPPQIGNTLPKDETFNGLPAIEKSLIDPLHAGDIRYAVVKFRTSKIVRKVADGDVYPVLEYVHFEPITTQAGEDEAAANLLRHFQMRTDLTEIPVPVVEQPTLDMPAETTTELPGDSVD